jgi:predicted NBD/HSP70 family sugar kinase
MSIRGSREVDVVFDFGGTNFRGGYSDRSTGETVWLHTVETPSPPAPTDKTPHDYVQRALDELFENVAARLEVENATPRAVSVSSRGAFSNVKGKLWWVPRSLPTMEFSPWLTEMTQRYVRTKSPEISDREVGTRALVVPTFPLQHVLEQLTVKHFGLVQEVRPLQDAAANLLAEAGRARRDGKLQKGQTPALLIVGTGIGLAVLKDGKPVLDKDGHGPAISRLVVDEATGLTLTAATNGPALEKKFGRKAGNGDKAMIDHAVGYLTPILKEQLTQHDVDHLIVTGGVADGLGPQFCTALEGALRRSGIEISIQPGELGDSVGLIGAAEAARINYLGVDRTDLGQKPLLSFEADF